MDSPERDPFPVSAPAATSRPLQESPFFSFASGLPSISSDKAAKHTTWLSETIFPSTPPVFKSPQPDPQQKTSFLKSDEGLASPPCGTNVLVSHDYGQGGLELKGGLIACSEKEIQSGVPFGCVDEYLTDPANVGVTDSADGYVQPNYDASQQLERGFPGSIVTDKKFDDADDGNDGVHAKILLDPPERHLPSSSSSCIYGEVYNDYVEFLTKGVDDHAKSDMILEHLEEGQNVKVQNVGGQHNGYGGSLVHEHAGYTVSCRPVPDGFSKFIHTQRGIRRHLHFEGGRDLGSSSNNNKISSPNVGPSASSQAIRSTALKTPFFLAIEELAPNLCSQEELMPGRSHNISEDLSIISVSKVGGAVDADNYDQKKNNQAFAVSTGVIDAGNYDHMSSFNSSPFPCFYQLDPQGEGVMIDPQNVERFEELCQNSPKRNRKRTKSTSKTEGSKTCNCKRSQCSKLYCECFTAGVFCGDSCACDNCFNKPENEDAIVQKRKDIELRCPQAFARKEEVNGTTPSSARHKRGCNCKKSKCSKRYCECFQANVGCCDGCRCESCENSFGRKQEFMFYTAERWRKPSSENLYSSQSQNDGIFTEANNLFISPLGDISNITPLSHSRAMEFSTLTVITSDRSSIQWKDELGFGSSCTDNASPNQKRVLSPQQPRSVTLSSDTCYGLRSDRKFVLQAVPSFPPLSP